MRAVLGNLAGGHYWTPKDMTPYAWYDAADTTTLTDAGSGHISAMTNKSGAGPTLTQATDADRPVSGTHTVNGRNTLNFLTTGTNNLAATGSSVPVTPFTVFFCFKALTVTVHQMYDLGGSGTVALLTNNPNWTIQGNTLAGNSGVAAVAGTVYNTVVMFDGSTATKLWVNGTQRGGSMNVGAATVSILRIGYGGGVAPDQDFCEMSIVSGDMTGGQHQTYWNQYCQGKWGTAG